MNEYMMVMVMTCVISLNRIEWIQKYEFVETN